MSFITDTSRHIWTMMRVDMMIIRFFFLFPILICICFHTAEVFRSGYQFTRLTYLPIHFLYSCNVKASETYFETQNPFFCGILCIDSTISICLHQ